MGNYTRKDMIIENFDELYKVFADALKNVINGYDLIVDPKALSKALDDIVNDNCITVLSKDKAVGYIDCIKDKKMYLLGEDESGIKVFAMQEEYEIDNNINEDIIFKLFSKIKGASSLGAGYDNCELKDFLAGVSKYLKEEN